MPIVTRVDRDGTSWAAALRRGWNIVTYSLPPSGDGTDRVAVSIISHFEGIDGGAATLSAVGGRGRRSAIFVISPQN